MKKAFSTAKTDLNWLQMGMIWGLTILLPILISFQAFDYFNEKYREYSQTKLISEYEDQISFFNHSLKPEAYLQNQTFKILKLINEDEKARPEQIVDKIAGAIEVRPIMAIFRENKNGSLFSVSYKPEDIKEQIFPHKILFRKIFALLSSKASKDNSKAARKISESRLIFQQLFKTLTTSTLLKNKVARNYSVSFGGEIFFQILEAQKGRRFSHAILVYRGRDMSSQTIFKHAAKNGKNIKLVLKPVLTSYSQQQADNFNSGVRICDDGIKILAPTNQTFVRHFLHEGGNRVVKELDKIPFLEILIPEKTIDHPIKAYRKLFRSSGVLIIILTAMLFFRFTIFPDDLPKSLKKRALGAIILASIFPFSTMAVSLYLFRSFDKNISRLNLIQHMEMKIAQNFEQIFHRITEYETFLASRPDLSQKFLNISDDEFTTLCRRLGKILPFSEAVYVSKEQNFSCSFPQRASVFKMKGSDPIWSFLPTMTLNWLKEDGRNNRTPQHYFLLAGKKIKVSFAGDSMQSVGGLYLLNQGSNPVWVSSNIITGNASEEPAILNLKYDLGPILSRYYSDKTETGFFHEKFGQAEIDYGFFPIRQISEKDFWQGSFANKQSEIFAPYLNTNTNQIYRENLSDKEKIVMIRTNLALPHKVIAIARLSQGFSGFSISQFIYAGFLFMLLLLYFSSLLLDRFLIEPVFSMAESAEKVARGAVDWKLRFSSGDELEALNRSFSEMIAGLKQRNLLKDYVSKEAISEIEQNLHSELYPGGEYCEATVIFAEIRNFSELYEQKPSQETIEALNKFVTICDEASKKQGGNIDKIIEKTIMLVFRHDANIAESHCLRAATAAIELRKNLAVNSLKLQAGIASGKVISGRIGSYKGKLDFTVIGDTVNLAARLKIEAFNSDAGIIISGSAMRVLKGKARVHFLRRCSIKGKSREFNIYELDELRSQV
jgi:class 3 adenylate cyclase